MGGSDPPIREPLIKEWLDRTISGPFDGGLADFVREISHIGNKEVTFPGVQIPLPPQLVLALTAWLQGQILEAMGLMTALNTVAPGPDGDYVFGQLPEPPEAAAVGQACMRMLTLQLGLRLTKLPPAANDGSAVEQPGPGELNRT